MKKLILSVALLFVFSLIMSPAAKSDPTVILKLGYGPGNDIDKETSGEVQSFTFALESSECKTYCLSPNFTHLSTQFGKHAGLGLDLVYKPFSRLDDALRLSLGVIVFDKPLNFGERSNFHIGVAFELYTSDKMGVILSYDHYSNGRKQFNRSNVERNIQVDVFSLGIHF